MSEAQGQSIDARMSDAVEAMDRDLNHIRTGRASTSLVDRVHVDYYGTSMTLNQLASISVPEATTVVIQPWDRNALQPIERAIMKSDIGITPNVDGMVIRLNIPPLTEERRRDLVKLVHKRMEEARVEIRNHRRDAVDSIKKREKDGLIGADEARREQEAIEKATHRWIDEVDRVGKAKEQEVLEV
jgi:ribosome recycling factor